MQMKPIDSDAFDWPRQVWTRHAGPHLELGWMRDGLIAELIWAAGLVLAGVTIVRRGSRGGS